MRIEDLKDLSNQNLTQQNANDPITGAELRTVMDAVIDEIGARGTVDVGSSAELAAYDPTDSTKAVLGGILYIVGEVSVAGAIHSTVNVSKWWVPTAVGALGVLPVNTDPVSEWPTSGVPAGATWYDSDMTPYAFDGTEWQQRGGADTPTLQEVLAATSPAISAPSGPGQIARVEDMPDLSTYATNAALNFVNGKAETALSNAATAQATANNAIPLAQKGAANGVMPLGPDGFALAANVKKTETILLTSSGTWTKPARLLMIRVRLISAGQAGAGGANYATGAQSGGAGGNAGGMGEYWIPADMLPDTVPYAVGAGGIALPVQTTANQDGVDGVVGGVTSFWNLLQAGASTYNSGGRLGANSTMATSAAPSLYGSYAGKGGASLYNSTTAAQSGETPHSLPGGGGGGAAIQANGLPRNGGGCNGPYPLSVFSGGQTAQGGTPGGDKNGQSATNLDGRMGIGGGGGAGGASSVDSDAGNGGNGGFPGGGGR